MLREEKLSNIYDLDKATHAKVTKKRQLEVPHFRIAKTKLKTYSEPWPTSTSSSRKLDGKKLWSATQNFCYEEAEVVNHEQLIGC